MKDCGKFYCNFVYVIDILYILWSFCIFCGHFAIFLTFWYVAPRKIWQPWSRLDLWGARLHINKHQVAWPQGRVARWYIFKHKIPIWVNLGGSGNRRFWYIFWPLGQFSRHLVFLWSFGIVCDHLVYFMAIWYILWSFGIFSPVWYFVPRKIWQPCLKVLSVGGRTSFHTERSCYILWSEKNFSCCSLVLLLAISPIVQMHFDANLYVMLRAVLC
jgi:hypothetical protein